MTLTKLLKKFIYSCTLLSSTFLSAQIYSEEIRDLKNFTSISVGGPFDVVVHQDKTFKIVVDAPDDIVDDLDISVKGGVLHLHIAKNKKNKHDYDGIEFFVSLPKIDTLKLNGSGDIRCENIASKKLRLALQGSGDIVVDSVTGIDLITQVHGSGDITLSEIQVVNSSSNIHGSGDITISGQSKSVKVKIHGSGDFDGKGLVAETAETEVFGSGDIDLKRAKIIKKKVHGSGQISVIEVNAKPTTP